MNKSVSCLLSSLLALSVAACDNAAKTSSEAPDSTNTTIENVNQQTAQTNQDDATSEMRRKQLNSDIRAREQRSETAGNQSAKTSADLASQVRSKLEANLPASALTVNSENGAVTVTGSVVNEEQMRKIEPLAMEIGGVKSVTVNATVSAAAPKPPEPGSDGPIKAQTGSN